MDAITGRSGVVAAGSDKGSIVASDGRVERGRNTMRLPAVLRYVFSIAGSLTFLAATVGWLLRLNSFWYMVLFPPAILLILGGYASNEIDLLVRHDLEWKRRVLEPLALLIIGLSLAEVWVLSGFFLLELSALFVGAAGLLFFLFRYNNVLSLTSEQAFYGEKPFETRTVLRASNFIWRDYWLVDTGVVQVELVSKWLTVAVIAVFFGTFEVALPLMGFGEPNPIAAMGFVGIAFYMLFAMRWAESKRWALLNLSPEEAAHDVPRIRLIDWSEVSTARLRRTDLELVVKGKEFRTKVMSDRDEVADFLRRHLDRRFFDYNSPRPRG